MNIHRAILCLALLPGISFTQAFTSEQQTEFASNSHNQTLAACSAKFVREVKNTAALKGALDRAINAARRSTGQTASEQLQAAHAAMDSVVRDAAGTLVDCTVLSFRTSAHSAPVPEYRSALHEFKALVRRHVKQDRRCRRLLKARGTPSVDTKQPPRTNGAVYV